MFRSKVQFTNLRTGEECHLKSARDFDTYEEAQRAGKYLADCLAENENTSNVDYFVVEVEEESKDEA